MSLLSTLQQSLATRKSATGQNPGTGKMNSAFKQIRKIAKSLDNNDIQEATVIYFSRRFWQDYHNNHSKMKVGGYLASILDNAESSDVLGMKSPDLIESLGFQPMDAFRQFAEGLGFNNTMNTQAFYQYIWYIVHFVNTNKQPDWNLPSEKQDDSIPDGGSTVTNAVNAKKVIVTSTNKKNNRLYENAEVITFDSPTWGNIAGNFKIESLDGGKPFSPFVKAKGIVQQLKTSNESFRHNVMFIGKTFEQVKAEYSQLLNDPQLNKFGIEERFLEKAGPLDRYAYSEWRSSIDEYFSPTKSSIEGDETKEELLAIAKDIVISIISDGFEKLYGAEWPTISIDENGIQQAYSIMTKGKNSGYPHFTSKWNNHKSLVDEMIYDAYLMINGEVNPWLIQPNDSAKTLSEVDTLELTPHILFRRVQANGDNPKQRPVMCPSKVEALAAKCFTDVFVNVFKETRFFSGFNGGENCWNNADSMFTFEHFFSGDHSKLDQNIKARMADTIDVIKHFVHHSHHAYLDNVLHYYQYSPVITPDGIVHSDKPHGLMSGDGFTSVIGTLGNAIGVIYTLISYHIRRYPALSKVSGFDISYELNTTLDTIGAVADFVEPGLGGDDGNIKLYYSCPDSEEECSFVYELMFFGDDFVIASSDSIDPNLFSKIMKDTGFNCNPDKQEQATEYYAFLGYYYFRERYTQVGAGVMLPVFPGARILSGLYYAERYIESAEEIVNNCEDIIAESSNIIDRDISALRIYSKLHVIKNHASFIDIVRYVRENESLLLNTERFAPLEKLANNIREHRLARNYGIFNSPVIRVLYALEGKGTSVLQCYTQYLHNETGVYSDIVSSEIINDNDASILAELMSLKTDITGTLNTSGEFNFSIPTSTKTEVSLPGFYFFN